MNPQIIIRVSPEGETQVRTEGFSGASCRQASQFIERALGSQRSEQLTEEYFQTAVGHDSRAQLDQGESS